MIWWITLGLAVALSAALVAAVPRRFMAPAMLTWTVLPLALYAGMVLWEALTRPPTGYVFGTALYGLVLVSPILVMPWLATCLAGFGLGFGLRRLRGRNPAPTVPAALARAAPVQPPQETPGWRHVHIGFDGDALSIGGLAVWQHKWRQAAGPPVVLPHPAHPNQVHDYKVFSIGDAARPVRFAACELSNGVWGFSIRGDDPITAQGTSGDGSLRYEHRLRTAAGGSGPASPSAVLIDAASGAVLADCAGWAESRITPAADGSMVLHLQQNHFNSLFRIDPATRQFRDLGEGGPPRPLTALADAIEEARRSAARTGNNQAYRRISPDGTIRVDLATAEWANSHWVNSPRVVHVPTGRMVLDLWGTDWHAFVSFSRSRVVRLSFRRYRGGGGPVLEIDVAQETYRFVSEPDVGDVPRTGPLADVTDALETWWQRLAPATTLNSRGTARDRGPSPVAAWRTAVALAIGAALAIAGATYISLQTGTAAGGWPPVPQRTTSIPAFK